MSLAPRATTPKECVLFRQYGFVTSALESMGMDDEDYHGYWAHPTLTPHGHVGPDEVLAIIEKLPVQTNGKPQQPPVRRTTNRLVAFLYEIVRDGYVTRDYVEAMITQGAAVPNASYSYPMPNEALANAAEDFAARITR